MKTLEVREGDIVEKGQVLLTLDDTRSSAMLRESEAWVNNLGSSQGKTPCRSLFRITDISG